MQAEGFVSPQFALFVNVTYYGIRLTADAAVTAEFGYKQQERFRFCVRCLTTTLVVRPQMNSGCKAEKKAG